eukprot:RCo042109
MASLCSCSASPRVVFVFLALGLFPGFVHCTVDAGLHYQAHSDELCSVRMLCDDLKHMVFHPMCYSFFHPKCTHDPDRDRVMNKLDRFLEDFKGHSQILEEVRGKLSLKLDNPQDRIHMHFAGDNGVGKTWLAQLISAALSGRRSSDWPSAGDTFYQVDITMGKLDENASKTDISRASNDIEGQLLQAINLCPQAVILVDELQELHPGVVPVLGRLLKGEPLRSGATTVPTAEATVILTSEFGRAGGSHGKARHELIAEVNRYSLYTDPALANNVRVLLFSPFSKADFREIVRQHLRKLPCKVRALKAAQWDEETEELLTDVAWKQNEYNYKNGRQVDDTFQEYVSAKVSSILGHVTTAHSRTVTLRARKSEVEIVVEGDDKEL